MKAENIVPLDGGAGGLEVRHGHLGGPEAVLFVVVVHGPDVDLERLGHQLVAGDGNREVFTKGRFGQITYSSSAKCADHICNSW